MKKVFIFIGIVIIIALIVIAIVSFNNNNNQDIAPSPNNSGTRLSTNTNEDAAENRISSLIESQNKTKGNKARETQISTFSTEILDDTPGRLTNISITCSTLNNTIVHAGQTFSFNDTVGEPTAERGYQEAKVIVDNEAELGIGRWKLPSK